LVTVDKSAETIQGRKLFKGGNYSRKYGMYREVKLFKVESLFLWAFVVALISATPILKF
jgi:hypothetical protein